MKTFETSSIVQGQGEVRVAGVPFAAGTEVDVTISPRTECADTAPQQGDAAPPPAGGLRWRGNVLVHEGVGASASVGELRDARLDRLGGR